MVDLEARSRYRIDTIRAEWPASDLDQESDLARWREGMALYAAEDYSSMKRCAELLSPALAHCLYGVGFLRGPDLPETVHRVLFASLFPPPDCQTVAPTSERAARLALTLLREYRWQPVSMGGDGRFGQFFNDTGNYLVLSSSIGPEGSPWEGNLREFFSIPPSPIDVPIRRAPACTSVDVLHDHMQRADAGDSTSQAYFDGVGLWYNGRREEALSSLAEAANRGLVHAMKDAGDVCLELGNGEAFTWFRKAAEAGHPGAMHNLGVAALERGDVASASEWFERAAAAGDAGAHVALTQLALDRGDDKAQRHWAHLGAEAGEPFCMFRHGLNLLKEYPDDAPIARIADHYVEAAAQRGNVDAMGLAAHRQHARVRPTLSEGSSTTTTQTPQTAPRGPRTDADSLAATSNPSQPRRWREQSTRAKFAVAAVVVAAVAIVAGQIRGDDTSGNVSEPLRGAATPAADSALNDVTEVGNSDTGLAASQQPPSYADIAADICGVATPAQMAALNERDDLPLGTRLGLASAAEASKSSTCAIASTVGSDPGAGITCHALEHNPQVTEFFRDGGVIVSGQQGALSWFTSSRNQLVVESSEWACVFWHVASPEAAAPLAQDIVTRLLN
jgi:TPR repeat protein